MDAAQVKQRALDLAKKGVPPQARARLVKTRMSVRQRSAEWRGLPDVLVIGGMRCGTSSLYKYLGYHPSIAPSLQKESEYFSRYYRRGENWYRSHFPLRARTELHSRLGRGRLISFEASPYYLYHPLAPARAAALVPEARIIVMLRDPIDRAFSHWQHMTLHGIESLSFEDALDAEEERLAPERERMRDNPLYFSRAHYYFSYADRGRYTEQLERWRQHYPSDKFLVVVSEDLYRDTATTYAGVLRFMGAAPWTPASFENYSYLGAGVPDASVTRQSSEISDATRERLTNVFRSDQLRLPEALDGMVRITPS